MKTHVRGQDDSALCGTRLVPLSLLVRDVAVTLVGARFVGIVEQRKAADSHARGVLGRDVECIECCDAIRRTK